MGRVAGYAGDIAFFAHAVSETNQGIEALIGAAPAFPGPGFLLPTRNHEVFEWCLDRGLRLVMQTTLMTLGLYNEPSGAYLPSILYRDSCGPDRFPCRVTPRSLSSIAMDDRFEGGCLCGCVRFVATGRPSWVAWCHCQSCRRHSAGRLRPTRHIFPEERLPWLHLDDS
jgi:hypothetical protein